MMQKNSRIMMMIFFVTDGENKEEREREREREKKKKN